MGHASKEGDALPSYHASVHVYRSLSSAGFTLEISFVADPARVQQRDTIDPPPCVSLRHKPATNVSIPAAGLCTVLPNLQGSKATLSRAKAAEAVLFKEPRDERKRY